MSVQPNPLADALDDLASAIEPDRVLILSIEEQRAILQLVGDMAETADLEPIEEHLAKVVQHGPTYRNEADEMVRITLRKRRLEEEVRRINKRIADLEEPIVEQLTELGMKSMRHDETGATLRRDDRVWVRYANPDLSADEKTDVKARAAALMQSLGGPFEAFVKPDYNANTISAYFREQYRQLCEDQQQLPEHERRPINAEDLMPECLRDLLMVDAVPHIQVRAS